MAPEQRSGKPCDARSDQYSFCLVLHEALFAALPGEPKLRELELPSWLTDALERGLSERPGDRFASMAELADALTPRASRWRVLLAIAAAVVAAGGLGAALLLPAGSSRSCDRAGHAVDAVWGPTQRDAVQRSLLKAKTANPQALVARVHSELDRFAMVLREARRQTCRADIKGTEPRSKCLERQLQRMRSVVAQLSRADRGVALRAAMVVGAATRQSCNRPSQLLPVVASRDPSRLRKAEAEADDIAIAIAAGKGRDLGPRVRSLVSEARALGHQGLLIDALTSLANYCGVTGKEGEHADALEELIRVASSAGHDWSVAIGWISLMTVVSRRKGGIPRALGMRPAIESAIARSDNDPVLRARYANQLGALFRKMGKPKESPSRISSSAPGWPESTCAPTP